PWCSKVWVGLWVGVFGATSGNLLKRMVGLGGLEPPTSPLSGARSSHLSYRPKQLWQQLFLLYRTRQVLAILASQSVPPPQQIYPYGTVTPDGALGGPFGARRLCLRFCAHNIST